MKSNENIEKAAKAYLEQSADDISPEISRRLQQARNAALEKAKPRTIWSYYPQAATAVIAIVVMTLSLNFNVINNESTELNVAMETEMEMFTSNDSLELMEDLEFIQWAVELEEYAG